MPRVAPATVHLMAESGCPTGVIAARLGISERTVRRHLAGRHHTPNPLVGTPGEWRLWLQYLRHGESLRHVGRRFGVSHETIRQVASGRCESLTTQA